MASLSNESARERIAYHVEPGWAPRSVSALADAYILTVQHGGRSGSFVYGNEPYAEAVGNVFSTTAYLYGEILAGHQLEARTLDVLTERLTALRRFL